MPLSVYYELGYLNEKEGEFVQSLKYYNKSFKAGLAVDKVYRACIAMAQAGALLNRSSHYNKALNLLHKSLDIFEKAPEHNLRWIKNCCYHLVDTYSGLEDSTQAKKYFDRYHNILVSSKFSVSQHDYFFLLGRLQLRQGKYIQALESLDEAIKQTNTIAEVERERVSEIMHDLGQAYLAVGQVKEAQECFERSLLQPAHLTNLWGHAMSLLELGRHSHNLGQNKESCDYLEQSIVLFRKQHSTKLALAKTLLNKISSGQASYNYPR